MEEFECLFKLLVELIDFYEEFLDRLLDRLPIQYAFQQFVKRLQTQLRIQIDKFYILEHKEGGYEGLTVLPIFGQEAVYIPRNRIKDRLYQDTWSSDEEDWGEDTRVDGVSLYFKELEGPKEPQFPPSGIELDLMRSFESLTIQE